MEVTEANYDDFGITPRQIDAIFDHDPLSHDILETPEHVEAKYQPLTVSVPPPTILGLSRFSPGYAVEFAHHLPDIIAFAEYVDIGLGESVLDLGTGLGWVLSQLFGSRSSDAPADQVLSSLRTSSASTPASP